MHQRLRRADDCICVGIIAVKERRGDRIIPTQAIPFERVLPTRLDDSVGVRVVHIENLIGIRADLEVKVGVAIRHLTAERRIHIPAVLGIQAACIYRWGAAIYVRTNKTGATLFPG